MLRRTLHGAEVHHALVVGRSLAGGQQRLRQFGKLVLARRGVDGCVDAEVAGEDAVDVAVDDGYRQVEGDAADGCRRVVAHAFECAEALYGVGKSA